MQESPQSLETLLQQCTVKITVPGGWGTGFCVAPGWLLTCDHVVRSAAQNSVTPLRVRVQWQRGGTFAEAEAELVERLPDLDLALLQFQPGAWDLPCVDLDGSLGVGDELYFFGYPDRDFDWGCPVTASCEGFTGDEPPLIKFKLGQVRPGMSGAALLNRRTGKVCGMVKFTRDRSIDLGGGAISVDVILRQFPQLRPLQQEFHRHDRRWRESMRWTKAQPQQPRGRSLSRPEYRQRQSLLTQMRTEVESRLSQSIHRAAFVNLGKKQQPQQVQRPWDMSVKVGEQRSIQLPPQTTVLDVFGNPMISGKFLILGKPGGGKTTTLLELAEALLERAEEDSGAPIPVILELSSWQEVVKRKLLPFGKREKYDPSIKEWVLSQLMSKGVSQEIGEQWLREKELVLLLDGLDELQPKRQAKCVQAINQFLRNEFAPLHLVVCSRKEEYENHEETLHLNGAICLEDLTNQQIQDYLTSVNLREFWESIKGSEKVIDFIRQPLFLAITSIAYQQIDIEEWKNCNTGERAIDYLMGVYRVNRIGKEKKFAIKTQNHLRAIAFFLNEENNSSKISKDESPRHEFHYLNLINPSIIRITKEKNLSYLDHVDIFYKILFVVFILFSYSLMFAPESSAAYFSDFIALLIKVNFLSLHWWLSIISLFIFALLMSIVFIAAHGFYTVFTSFLAFTIVLSPLGFLLPETDDRDYELPKRIMKDHKRYLNKYLELPKITTGLFIFTSIFKMAEVLFNYFFSKQAETFTPDLISFTYLWLLIIIPFWILMRIRLLTYELIGKFILCDTYLERLSFHALMIIFMGSSSYLIGFICCQFLVFLGLLENTIIFNATVCFVILPVISVYVGLVWGGGVEIIKSLKLRLFLVIDRAMPWNITRFLDYCTERLILQRVGNRYRFIHRLVQEHFAKLEIQKE